MIAQIYAGKKYLDKTIRMETKEAYMLIIDKFYEFFDNIQIFITYLWLIRFASITVSGWFLFKKAGENPFKTFIPFYNFYILSKITWGNGLPALFALVPVVGEVYVMLTGWRLAKVFGERRLFAYGMALVPIIFYPMLALGNYKYEGPASDQRNNCVIATVIFGAVFIVLFYLFMIFTVWTTFAIQKQTRQFPTNRPYIRYEYPRKVPRQNIL